MDGPSEADTTHIKASLVIQCYWCLVTACLQFTGHYNILQPLKCEYDRAVTAWISYMSPIGQKEISNNAHGQYNRERAGVTQ